MNQTNHSLAYALLRITVGLNFLLHGAVRLFGDLAGFAAGLAKGFAGILPEWLISPFAYALTIIEFVGGLVLLLGFQTPKIAAFLMVVMMTLIFGKSLQQDWATVGSQMLYSLMLFVLIFLAEHDRWGITSAREK